MLLNLDVAELKGVFRKHLSWRVFSIGHGHDSQKGSRECLLGCFGINLFQTMMTASFNRIPDSQHNGHCPMDTFPSRI